MEQAELEQDDARMTDSNGGIKYIEKASATSEERRTYATGRNQEEAVMKQRPQRNTRRSSVTWKLNIPR